VLKFIREILGLLWKLIRTLLKNHLRTIIKRFLVTAVFTIGFVALLIFVITRLFL
jgi:hypothetical protein